MLTLAYKSPNSFSLPYFGIPIPFRRSTFPLSVSAAMFILIEFRNVFINVWPPSTGIALSNVAAKLSPLGGDIITSYCVAIFLQMGNFFLIQIYYVPEWKRIGAFDIP